MGPFRNSFEKNNVHPRKFNMEPKNEGLEDVFPFHKGDSQVPC